MVIHGGDMAKGKRIPVLVNDELHAKLLEKSQETAVSLSEIARRAWQIWLETGEMPKSPKTTKQKRGKV